MKIYRTTPKEQLERVAREAAEWLQVMKAEPGTAEREAFAAWLAASPLHAREMLLAGMLDRELARPGVLDGFDVEAAVARAAQESNVVPLPARATPNPSASVPTRARRGLPWRRAASIAAVFLLALSGWIAMRGYVDAGTVYATTVGAPRTLRLADGTSVALAPDSRIRVAFSAERRRITLLRGEAEFDVAHDTARPLSVYAGANRIRDIGTRFSVNRLPSGTVVSVTEGSVQVTVDHLAALGDGLADFASTLVSTNVAAIERPGVKVEPLGPALQLVAGQEAHIARDGRSLTRGKVDPQSQAPANADRLSFHDDTLADIVTEFNRYSTTPITIADDHLKLQRYSGVFDASDAQSFLQFLDCCSQLSVVRHTDRWVIEARAGAPERR